MFGGRTVFRSYVNLAVLLGYNDLNNFIASIGFRGLERQITKMRSYSTPVRLFRKSASHLVVCFYLHYSVAATMIPV